MSGGRRGKRSRSKRPRKRGRGGVKAALQRHHATPFGVLELATKERDTVAPVNVDPIPHGLRMLEPPTSLRCSTIMRRLEADGAFDLAGNILRMQRDQAKCELHGDLEDPIIGLMNDRIVFACPHCSGDAVREAWLKEGLDVIDEQGR